jgi:hypothetical protein
MSVNNAHDDNLSWVLRLFGTVVSSCLAHIRIERDMKKTHLFEFSPGDGEVVARLRALLNIASKLEAAGWPMQLTVTGLSFGATVRDERKVAKRLAELGIEEPFTPFMGRTVAELREAQLELDDRVWCERQQAITQKAPDLRGKEKVDAVLLRKKFPAEDDFGWRMVNGKLSAVRWVFGDDWDMLDT